MFPKIKILIFEISFIIIKTSFIKNCKIIESISPFKYKECKKNYILLNNNCPCYDKNCISCTSSGSCNECKLSFILNKNEKNYICNIYHCIYFSEEGCESM